RLDGIRLTEADLEDEGAVLLQARRRLRDEAADDVEAVRACEERHRRLVIADLGLQTRAIAVAHVRRIGDDEIEWTVDAVEEIGVNEPDLRIDAKPRRVAPRNLECRIGKVGRDEPRDRTVVGDRYGETSAARADVSDLVARGCRRAIGDLEPNLDDELGLGPWNE